VALHRRYGLKQLIDVSMTSDSRFTVQVIDRGPAESAQDEPGETTGAIIREVAAATGRLPVDEEALTAGVGLALLRGVVADLTVDTAADGAGTEVRMSWPIGRRVGK
jgi:hypothetical protein